MTDRCTIIGCGSLEVVGVCREGNHGYCVRHGPSNGRGLCDRHRTRMAMLLSWGKPARERKP